KRPELDLPRGESELFGPLQRLSTAASASPPNLSLRLSPNRFGETSGVGPCASNSALEQHKWQRKRQRSTRGRPCIASGHCLNEAETLAHWRARTASSPPQDCRPDGGLA